jgi:hypothetical protein
MWGHIYFSFSILFLNKGKSVILVRSFKGKNEIFHVFFSTKGVRLIVGLGLDCHTPAGQQPLSTGKCGHGLV